MLTKMHSCIVPIAGQGRPYFIKLLQNALHVFSRLQSILKVGTRPLECVAVKCKEAFILFCLSGSGQQGEGNNGGRGWAVGMHF